MPNIKRSRFAAFMEKEVRKSSGGRLLFKTKAFYTETAKRFKSGLRGGKEYAWWNLPKDQKLALQNARKSGMFGGIVGVAPYMWVQEGSTEEGAAGAAKAAISPTRFIENALVNSEATIAGIIERAMANAG